MSQQNRQDTLLSDLEALAKGFEAKQEDRRTEAQRGPEGLPSEHGIRTFDACGR